MLRGIGSDDKFAQVVLALQQFNDNLAAIQQAITDNAGKLVTSVDGNGSGQTRSAPQEIHIINRVPRILLEIIQQQFSTMQAWLQPLHQAASANNSRVQHLEQVLQQTLHRYTELLKRLEDGKSVASLKE